MPELTSYCRDRYGLFNVSVFHLWACSMCYKYIFSHRPVIKEIPSYTAFELIHPLDPGVPPYMPLYPDLLEHAKDPNSRLCKASGYDTCQKLSLCCQQAASCCSNQIENRKSGADQSKENDVLTCPQTWDGYACFKATPAGQKAQIMCPPYIENSDDNGLAVKQCTENGTWWTNPQKGLEWTDYTGCVTLKGYWLLYIVGVVSNSISLLCLVPACVIFIKFKHLRKQHRVRIHLNLFASFILTSSVWLGWDHAIFRDRLDNSQASAVMHQRSEICRILYVLSRYSWTCNFVWMSLEGFHLYRLINHAFKAPKSIISYYFIGWLAPCVPICLYSIARVSKLDDGCWINHAGNLEWIMYVPNLICILLNVAFLFNILRILLTQIQSHPNEPSNYRRALKATFILIPLFGLQLFLIVYRPYEDVIDNLTYEVLAKIVSNSQGAIVAIVFCFFNSEVHGQIRNHGNRARTPNSHSHNDGRSCTFSTMPEVKRPSSRDGHDLHFETIPLRCKNVCRTRNDSPVTTIKWRTESDSSKIHMI